MNQLSRHAEIRMQQRGCAPVFVRKILDHADVDYSVGGGCRLYRVCRRTATLLKDDRLDRFGVIIKEDSGTIVTVLPIDRGRRGARYRRAH